MKQIPAALFVFMLFSSHAATIVPHDQAYYTAKVRNTELIYTQKNLPFAKQAAAVEQWLQPHYEALFGYKMDEPMYVGLLSEYNQIANGFMMPYPYNLQMNYIGGAMLVDYFSSTSWLNTLLYHETAHNYQMNAKANDISSWLHTLFKNGMVFVPWFTLPNITVSSFLLEGNGVLNESCHNNGGRLYSGRFKAEMLMQARAGYLTPERLYNPTYFFGDNPYILGGFYQYFLAQHYGLKAVNSFWRENSNDWYWPFFTNNAMKRAIGVDFETSVAQWRTQMEKEASKMQPVHGTEVATSQFYTPLNANENEIFFLVNESGRERPTLVRLQKKNLHVSTETSSFFSGKVLRVQGRYVTQAAANTSPIRIYQGLYDANGYVLEGTESKVVQGYLREGEAVYFDVSGSFDQPQLYVGNNFYAQVNSSVFIDAKDNLYYFVQEGKMRTLYKNRVPLTTFRGYYGMVVDVDADGNVYFIAASPYGSSLYRLRHGLVERMSRGDTVIDARLIDATTALAVLVGSNAYTYAILSLDPVEEQPFETTLFCENNATLDTKAADLSASVPDLEHAYVSVFNMDYSGVDLFLGNDESAGFLYNLSINFADPLGQNSLSIFSQRDIDRLNIAGIRYANTQYLLQYSLSAYAVLDHNESVETRDYGLAAAVRLPLLQRGYYSADMTANYTEDHEVASREPLSATLNLSKVEQYGVSMFANALTSASLYGMWDRDDFSYGFTLKAQRQLWGEQYLSVEGQYVRSDTADTRQERGIKLTQSLFNTSDPATVVMPSLRDTLYVSKASVARIGLRSVFNCSSYFFTFPVSLRREALKIAYSYYDLSGVMHGSERSHEIELGITFDTLWLNRLGIPLSVDVFYNDNAMLADKTTLRFSMDIAF